VNDPTLDGLLDALTQAAETGHGYLPARRAVVEHVERLRAQVLALRRAIESVSDDMGRLL
jgi:hypothetical protein